MSHENGSNVVAVRYWELDVLRFIAAVLVMLMHYLLRGFASGDNFSPYHFPSLGPLTRYFYLAVDLFFMISGFVIFLSVDRFGTGRSAALDFLRARALRLYPAYWVSCTLTFVVLLVFTPDFVVVSFGRYLANMSMLNGFIGVGYVDGVYWTLFFEVRFYLLVSLLVAFNGMKRVEMWLTFWLIASLANYFMKLSLVEYILFTKASAFFVAGSAFYLLKRDGYKLRLVLLLGMSYVVACLHDADVIHQKSDHYGLDFSVSTMCLIVLSFFLIFWLVGRRKISPFPRLLPVLGAMSYPLYLLHSYIGFVLFGLASNVGAPSWLAIISVVLLMMTTAFIVCHYVEPAVRGALRRIL